MDTPIENDNSLLKRYLALKLLRENIYFTQPNKYNAADFMGDFPGRLKTVAGLFEDVPTSLAVISRNTETRKAQVRRAIEKIKNTKEAKSEIGKQMLSNSLSMGLGGIPASFLLSSAIRLMGFRGLRGPGGKLRLPFSPVKTTKRIFNNEHAHRKKFTHGVINDTATGAILGAASGTAVPFLAGKTKLPDAALEDAARVIEAQPYLSSFPVADLLSVTRRNNTEKNDFILSNLKNGLLGVGLGGALGGITGAAAPLVDAPRSLWSAFSGKRGAPVNVIKKDFLNMLRNTPKAIKRTALPMAAVGGVLGSITQGLGPHEA
jgi:hypothetical protein